jgi:hypothetical protein
VAKGAFPGAYLRTNGHALSLLYYTRGAKPRASRFRRRATAEEVAEKTAAIVRQLQATSRIAADDTGIIIPSCVYAAAPHGGAGGRAGTVSSITARGYAHAINKASRVAEAARLCEPLQDVFAELAAATPRSSSWEGTLLNVAAMQRGRARLWDMRRLPFWRETAFESWRLRARVLARHYGALFAGSFEGGDLSQPLFLGNGEAIF